MRPRLPSLLSISVFVITTAALANAEEPGQAASEPAPAGAGPASAVAPATATAEAEKQGGEATSAAPAPAAPADDRSAIPAAGSTMAAEEPAPDASGLEGLLEQAVVSTASLASETSRAAPATVWTIAAEDLRRYGITTLDEAINFLSLGMQSERQMDYAEVGARGVLLTGDYGSHVLLLLDGHTLNEPWDSDTYFDRNAAIPFEAIDHIEVVLGPGSVLYGSNAMLGVMNVITKGAKDYDGAHLTFESQVPTSLRMGAGYAKRFSALGADGEALMQLEYYRSQGPAVDLGPQDYGVDPQTGLPRQFTKDGPADGIWGGTIDEGRFAQVPTGYARVSLGGLTLFLRGAIAERGDPYLTYNNFNDPEGRERDRWLNLDLRYEASLSSITSVTARLYGDLYDYLQILPSEAAENCPDGQIEGCRYRLDGKSQWTGAEVRGAFDWFGDGSVRTLVGVDGRFRQVSSVEAYLDYATGTTTTADEYGRPERALGAYLEQTLQRQDWLALNLGARLDADERFGSHVSPRATVFFAPWRDGAIKLIYSEAFRSPSAYERYFSDPTCWVAADDLQPEIVRALELAVEHRIGTHHFVLGVFRSSWTDLVVEADLSDSEIAAAQAAGQLDDGVSTAGKYENVAAVEDYGGNLAYEATGFGLRLRYGLTLTVAQARARTHVDGSGQSYGEFFFSPWPRGSEPLVVAADIFGNAHVSWDFIAPWPTLGLAVRAVGPRRMAASGFEPTPEAPVQVEARLAVTGPIPGLAGFSYRVTYNYAHARGAAYGVGPINEPTETYTEQEMVPVDRHVILVGLWYDLPI